MKRFSRSQGFTLIELLLVLAIIGIISAIAIPSFLGQRRRARIIGDAQANASVLRMQFETHKADAGIYGAANASFNWTPTGYVGTASGNPVPQFSTGSTKMKYKVSVGATGLTYTLTVTDPSLASATVYQTNQNGSNLFTLK
jgi:prepilin-type N-terminal cleavage/methylation domain-containing protein